MSRDEGKHEYEAELVRAESIRWANEVVEARCLLFHLEAGVCAMPTEVTTTPDGEPVLVMDSGDTFLARPGNFLRLTPKEAVSVVAAGKLVSEAARLAAKAMRDSGIDADRGRKLLSAAFFAQLRAFGGPGGG